MSRKTVRERLATLFAGQGFNQVNAYAPLDLNGATKVLNIYSTGSRPDFISSYKNDFYGFYLDVFVKRTNSKSPEDDLDTLHDVVTTVIRTNISDSNWSHLEFDGESVCLFAEVAGIPYRLERHKLLVKVTSG